MNVIEIRNLSKIYNSSEVKVTAVNEVSLNFSEGEFTAIVGPSGSGKTTLLNLIGGLDTASSGEIKVAGTNLNTLKASELIDFRLCQIGFVFQAYNLIPVLTAFENVELIMEMQGWIKKERTERAMDLLRRVGLEERAGSRPSKLSGGQQQRVAVARALASRPRFVIADEPTANLDSKATENLLEIMEELNREENVTFIFSTHDQRVVNKARRIITLEDGRVMGDIKNTIT